MHFCHDSNASKSTAIGSVSPSFLILQNDLYLSVAFPALDNTVACLYSSSFENRYSILSFLTGYAFGLSKSTGIVASLAVLTGSFDRFSGC